MAKKMDWTRAHTNPLGYDGGGKRRGSHIDDGAKGRGGPVRRFTPAELAAFAAAKGVTVAKNRRLG